MSPEGMEEYYSGGENCEISKIAHFNGESAAAALIIKNQPREKGQPMSGERRCRR